MPFFRRTTAAFLIATAVFGLSPHAQASAPLEKGIRAFARSDYAQAEKALAAVGAKHKARALVWQTRLLLRTGRYADAVKRGQLAAKRGKQHKVSVAAWVAEALLRQGKSSEAIRLLEGVRTEPGAYRANLLLGELYIQQGKRSEGEQALMTLVDAYNNDSIKDDDPAGLSLVGRATYLLRAFADANDAFQKAEQAGGNKRVETLLWRAQLFVDKYNPADAVAVAREALALAPNDPRVLVMMARVKLAQAMDFRRADKLIDKALAVDPHLAEAFFVRAGLRLRTMDLAAAEKATDQALVLAPANLELLSMKAAAKFLAEDAKGFIAIKTKVLGLNPRYSTFFNIVGEFAEWEHRYGEIVKLMREAVAIDSQDAKAFATLGLNLIRNGQDKEGLVQLRKAWDRDNYNIRVYNTLNLFEKVIAKEYVTVSTGRFNIRYHKSEKDVLERYLPPMLDRAWASMVKRYGFEPTQPVGIEMYAKPQHFSIRTSGLPNIGIQGVCFGKTLAALSPSAGRFNWGMVVWHELGHVFHIQRSKNRVPRWFTEGLAEYETIVVRPEWRREQELSLFQALRSNKLPKTGSFNTAFTHARNGRDVTMAYFTASQVLVFMAEKYGFDKVAQHLAGWAKGQQTKAIVQEVLGISTEQLDSAFQAWLKPRLARYAKQYVPNLRPPKLKAARVAVAAKPNDAKALVQLALALLANGKAKNAQATLQLALTAEPHRSDALFVMAKLAMRRKKLVLAKKYLDTLRQHGGDGYAVRMKLADLAEHRKDMGEMKKQLLEAHAFDPSQAEPLQGLHDCSRKQKDEAQQLFTLRQLAKLEQHDRRVYMRLLELLLKTGKFSEAVAVGESAIYVDVMNPKMHYLYARALARTGKHVSAIFELNSAILSRPAAKGRALVYGMMAEGYSKLGYPDYAKKASELKAKAVAEAQKKKPGAELGKVDGGPAVTLALPEKLRSTVLR